MLNQGKAREISGIRNHFLRMKNQRILKVQQEISRKSKRNIRNQKPFSQDEESKNIKSSTRNIEEMQLLLNAILVIALGIFLFLISGDASSHIQDNSSESITRIPATVSTVIDGYVQ